MSFGPGTTNLSPGVYIIDGTGGLNIGANATVTGNGVMFYFTCPPGSSPCSNGATVNMTGTPDVNMTAPSSTTCPTCATQYDGILFYQDPNDTNGPSLGGDTSNTYDGVLYFPKAQVTFYGNSSIGDIALVVADSLALSGHPTVNLLGASGLGNATTFIKNAVLVE